MDWKTSLDTTFSDVWKGSNLRRLLTLWTAGLLILAVYGTTVGGLTPPKIPTNDELASASGNRQACVRYAVEGLDEPTPLREQAEVIAARVVTWAQTLSPSLRIATMLHQRTGVAPRIHAHLAEIVAIQSQPWTYVTTLAKGSR